MGTLTKRYAVKALDDIKQMLQSTLPKVVGSEADGAVAAEAQLAAAFEEATGSESPRQYDRM